ncbi:MAG: hypothetical protein VKJ06_09565 [Vampirovibrionales bacterium]|nr:hypothetical protein [Vampirovibrionales bacterium]
MNAPTPPPNPLEEGALAAAQTANNFFKTFMNNQCHICWGMFTKVSQERFLAWCVDDLYKKHPQAVEASQIGPKEVRLLLERNDQLMIKSFWKRFFALCGANEIYRYGYFAPDLERSSEKETMVNIRLKLPDGRQGVIPLRMIKERGDWKMGYIESELPF